MERGHDGRLSKEPSCLGFCDEAALRRLGVKPGPMRSKRVKVGVVPSESGHYPLRDLALDGPS